MLGTLETQIPEYLRLGLSLCIVGCSERSYSYKVCKRVMDYPRKAANTGITVAMPGADPRTYRQYFYGLALMGAWRWPR